MNAIVALIIPIFCMVLCWYGCHRDVDSLRDDIKKNEDARDREMKRLYNDRIGPIENMLGRKKSTPEKINDARKEALEEIEEGKNKDA